MIHILGSHECIITEACDQWSQIYLALAIFDVDIEVSLLFFYSFLLQLILKLVLFFYPFLLQLLFIKLVEVAI